jgi:GMP synthase (glutamine-hydrolysing)
MCPKSLAKFQHFFKRRLVSPHSKKEYGRARVFFKTDDLLLAGVEPGFVSWMSHGDSIERLAAGYSILAETENKIPAVIRHAERPHWGLQFHPEVTHCEFGNTILKNFAINICNAKPEWNVEAYLKSISDDVRKKVEKAAVLLLISGGVDSAVVAALLLKALDPAQVRLMYIDTGLMRKGESEEVEAHLKKLGAQHLYHINAGERFLFALKGKTDPEEKRTIIGDMFMKVQETEVKKLNIVHAFLAQGTLYTDLIESGKGVGKKAHVIKSHHNVRSPLVEEKRKQGLILEPVATLYKDEVRALGRRLKLDEAIVSRPTSCGSPLPAAILIYQFINYHHDLSLKKLFSVHYTLEHMQVKAIGFTEDVQIRD